MKKLLTSMLLILGVVAFAQDQQYHSKNGIAIKGYDPVAYFTLGKAIVGKDEYSLTWSGSTWKFISQSHLDEFKQTPEKFAPQYGGFCAFGCSEKHKAPTDPNAWTIVNGKLYLNYNAAVKDQWIKDTLNRIKLADEFWSAMKQ